MRKSQEVKTRPSVTALNKQPSLPPLPTRAKPIATPIRIQAATNRFFYHSEAKSRQEIQTKASDKPSTVLAGFAAAAAAALLANQFEENETANKSGANLQSDEGSKAFRTAANSYSIKNLQLLLTSGYKLSDDDIRYVESSLTRFIPEKEDARAATAKLLVANGLSSVNPLESGIFSDFELVQNALPTLKNLSHDSFSPIACIIQKIGDLPQAYPADQKAIELFLESAL